MQKTLMTLAALSVATTMAVAPAHAMGDGGAEQRAKLEAEFEKVRKGESGPSLFDRLFGGGSDVAEGEQAPAQPTN